MRLSRFASVPRLGLRTLDRIVAQKSRVTVRRSHPLTTNGTTMGHVEVATWTRHHVDVEGWVAGGGVLFGPGETPPYPRDRRAAAPANRFTSGFRVRLNRTPSGASLLVRAGPDQPETPVVLSPPGRLREFLAHLHVLPGALGLVIRHRRDILRFLKTGDAGLSVSLRDAFGFSGQDTDAPLIPSGILDGPAPPVPAPERPAVVIVPVHNAPRHVSRLLNRLADGLDRDHRILLIDDGSTDPAIAPLLTAFAARHPDRVRLDSFPENRGFVAAVNHGFAVARDLGEHVIILNTDTLPPGGWVRRLIAPILTDPDVASVTPVSNTAEIASIPHQGTPSQIDSSLVDGIDAVASRLSGPWRQVDIPTGIGFAMAINRRFLDQVGPFDPAFGRGYGEEVDWCQRALALGGRHVLMTSVFIGHEGGSSFGAEKAERLAVSAAIIRSRYPGYDRAVQDWADAAPHAVQRIILTVPFLDAVSEGPVPVFLAHSLGGGAEMALRREIDDLIAAGAPGAVILRTGGSARWRLEIEGPGFRYACRTTDNPTLLKCLAPLRQKRVIYSCGAGGRDPGDVPEMLTALASDPQGLLEIRLHDFFPISPSYCLLTSRGTYEGIPDSAETDPAHDLPCVPGRHPMSLREWRTLWTRVIERADTVTAFSQSSAAILATAYPRAAAITRVLPHPDPPGMPEALPPGGRTIGVLGGINLAKGAAVLVALAREFRRRGIRRKIVIIGDLDPNFRLPRPHVVTGSYQRRDIARLARRHDVGLWLIPSIWPETYSFTTREALATGLPVLTFDRGAQAEAARAAINGMVLENDPSDIAALAEKLEQIFARPRP